MKIYHPWRWLGLVVGLFLAYEASWAYQQRTWVQCRAVHDASVCETIIEGQP